MHIHPIAIAAIQYRCIFIHDWYQNIALDFYGKSYLLGNGRGYGRLDGNGYGDGYGSGHNGDYWRPFENEHINFNIEKGMYDVGIYIKIE